MISSSSAFAHGVRPKKGAVHVCYCHSPFRYVYFSRKDALSEMPSVARPVMDLLLTRMGRWDSSASQRVDHYIANSELSRQRIADYYGRDASVVHPPVNVDRFAPGDPEDFFLVVTQVVFHNRVELALKAAKMAGRRVKIVGDGPDLPRLKALYPETAEFLGQVSDETLADLYQRALALIVPNVEEFGIAMVEAQAAGRLAEHVYSVCVRAAILTFFATLAIGIAVPGASIAQTGTDPLGGLNPASAGEDTPAKGEVKPEFNPGSPLTPSGGEDSPEQGGVQPEFNSGNAAPGATEPVADPGGEGAALPFTGFMAIPVLIAGLMLLGSGLVVRSRTRTRT